MLQSFDVNKYKQLKNEVQKMYRDEKVGNQQSYESQTKLFKPIIDTANEGNTRIERRIAENSQDLDNKFMPLVDAIAEANRQHQQELDYRKTIQEMSGLTDVFNDNVRQESTPKKETMRVDANKDFNTTDIENLQDLDMPMPSELVNDHKQIDDALEKIKMQNHKIGQFLGKKSTKNDHEKEIYRSQKVTLEKYKERLVAIKGAMGMIGTGLKKSRNLVKQKRGKGRPRKNHEIIYQDLNDLVQKLYEYMAAYKAGNNGVYNTIVGILDVLLNKGAITKTDYDLIYKTNFKNFI